MLATFCAPQFRQQENQTLGLDRDLWATLPDKLKARLGFKVWNAYGRIESPAEPMVDPEPARIGELRADGRVAVAPRRPATGPVNSSSAELKRARTDD